MRPNTLFKYKRLRNGDLKAQMKPGFMRQLHQWVGRIQCECDLPVEFEHVIGAFLLVTENATHGQKWRTMEEVYAAVKQQVPHVFESLKKRGKPVNVRWHPRPNKGSSRPQRGRMEQRSEESASPPASGQTSVEHCEGGLKVVLHREDLDRFGWKDGTRIKLKLDNNQQAFLGEAEAGEPGAVLKVVGEIGEAFFSHELLEEFGRGS